MESNATLHFTWEGDPKGSEEFKMNVYVDGQLATKFDYCLGAEVDLPVPFFSFTAPDGKEIELKCTVAKDGGREFTHFKRSFSVKPGKHYACHIDGSIKKSSGLSAQFCEGEYVLGDTPKLSGNKSYIIMMSLFFPVYGIYKAITDTYMRAAALIGGGIGFLLGLIVSSMADKHDTIGFGLGRLTLLEYKPFSFLDWIINLLIGGISSINGLLRMLLESLFN